MAVPAVEISRFERFSISTIEEERRVSRLNSSEINDGYHARADSFLFSFFSLFFPRDFIFNVATRYSIQPTHRIERGGRKMGGEEGVHDSTLKAVGGLIIQISQYSKN